MPRRFPTSARWCARARRARGATSTGASTRIARTLAGMGIGKGDKIAILAANSVEYLETFMGGLRAGACVVPLSTMAAADALEKMLDDCDAKVLFLSDQYRGLVEPYEDRLAKLIAGRPHRLRFRARRAGTTSSTGWRRGQRRCRSSCRSSRSTTSTSSTARARPACPRASCTPTPCATCWRCASRRSTTGRTRSRSPRRRSTRTPPWSRCWRRWASAARPS